MLKLPYGTSNFEKVASEDFYFVDRTPYIAQLERSRLDLRPNPNQIIIKRTNVLC